MKFNPVTSLNKTEAELETVTYWTGNRFTFPNVLSKA